MFARQSSCSATFRSVPPRVGLRRAEIPKSRTRSRSMFRAASRYRQASRVQTSDGRVNGVTPVLGSGLTASTAGSSLQFNATHGRVFTWRRYTGS